ncbi:MULTISPECIES: isoprenylcysteine carboxylmethyltransferase family protein [Mesorhizobium]|uniref:Protein-S-isoprenylcysteine O-methyltransferase Ste14 n=1 Tax=Mesorhizobium shonense TaxID=1209948 RepID=A0ABV2HWK4_9HYPH|nr:MULTISPECIES: isoprenylcysteine carboxylmethyltransferase family protein [unclassified Mesorhizobium]AZO29885.1 isoprenylcysteine carboxylmethyltransferase family protein [Mesorhizobium sp. M1B.F.Ca.ET.045.04.1.1]RWB20037.1 MAG: isoprenylcysteine carboxylmethyltransferase family protein [Mesorhizobium sp.]RWE01359.1 MAG: isoprenylcysteine carboxylmethyltransferase family protein [Mesorhizobium sp.]TIS51748.1 MAG: isoprenylcysteine carboxylmethyltransferase family protein [Mesorhizobium sp.]
MVSKLVVQTFLWFGFMGTLLFVSAGTLHWTGAWVYIVVMVGLSLTMGVALARRDPGLMNERLRPPIQKNQTAADKILLSILLLGIFGWLALMGFDFRFGWSPVSAWVQAIGALVLLVGIWICYLTMLENSFAAPVVKIQDERGQRVITTGPYSYVRHPMYGGAILYFAGTALLLGSWWGLASVLVFIVLLAIRTFIEEKTLRTGLRGYDDYAAHVRYRLIPLVW